MNEEKDNDKVSGFNNVRELISYSSGGVFSKVLDKNSTGDVTLFCMAAGTDMSEHTASRDGFIYVVEGDGIFNLEGTDIPMKEGVMFSMKKDAKHSLKANADTTFILFLRDA